MATVQFKNYYDVLGVDRAADEQAIRSAYRSLARKLHPDVNRDDPAAEERFKEVNEAYEVLSDADKRRMYDRFGRDWERYRDAGFTGDSRNFSAPGAGTEDFGTWFAGEGQSQPGAGFDDSNGRFSDFFTLLFGNGASERAQTVRGRPRPLRGEDTEVHVEVSLAEAFRGTTRRLTLGALVACTTCHGTGLARGTTCPTCDGTGQVARRRTIEVDVPAGVRTGSRVRIAGQGSAGRNGGPSGDVYLQIQVSDNPRFQRQGDDLKVSVEIPLYAALLGGEIIVPTMEGRVALTVPAETQNGRTFRLRGKGMPKLGIKSQEPARGDLLATVQVRLPTELSERERELLRELSDLRQ